MKYNRRLKYLDDYITVDLSGLLDSLTALAKDGIGSHEMKKALSKYWDEIEKLPIEDQILMHFWCQIKLADNIVTLVRSVSEEGINLVSPGLQFDGQIVNRVLRKYNRSFNKHMRPLVQSGVTFHHTTKEPFPLKWSEDWVRRFLLPHAFMTIWTGLESYLELRLKSAVLYDEDRMYDFAEKRDKFLPDRWKETEEKIKKVEYWSDLSEIIEEYLTFPYHNFGDKSKVSFVYMDCFGFAITKFKRIRELQRFSLIRHDLVHSGVAYLGTLTVDIHYRDVTRLKNLTLEFVEWIEEQIRTKGRGLKSPPKPVTS